MFFLWFLPLALMACLNSAETHSRTLHWDVQHTGKQTPLESTYNPYRTIWRKIAPSVTFWGTTTIDFVMGNPKRTEGTSIKGKRKKNVQVNREWLTMTRIIRVRVREYRQIQAWSLTPGAC